MRLITQEHERWALMAVGVKVRQKENIRDECFGRAADGCGVDRQSDEEEITGARTVGAHGGRRLKADKKRHNAEARTFGEVADGERRDERCS